MTHSIDWNDPVARHHLLQQIGPQAFNAAHNAHREASVIEVCHGHKLYPVAGLIAVGNTRMAFSKLEQARAFAAKNPA